MNLSFVEIRAELKPYIQSFWVFESPVGMPASETNMAAPNGCPKLIIPIENSITSTADGRVQESHAQGLYFVGNRDSSTLLKTSLRNTCFIGIEFFPHGAYPIFGLPMHETVNRLLAADVVFAKWGQDVRERLHNETSLHEKIDCIQSHLTGLVRRRQPQSSIVEHCVKSLKSRDGLISIRELERETGYSQRYLEILFKKHVGLSPKVLAGIFRFQRFYRKWAAKRPFDELKDELYDYYYDQAHFTKEFKRMTNFSPEHFTVDVSNEFGRRLSLG
jgi:AraC-like DNA-binding protein